MQTEKGTQVLAVVLDRVEVKNSNELTPSACSVPSIV